MGAHVSIVFSAGSFSAICFVLLCSATNDFSQQQNYVFQIACFKIPEQFWF